MRKNAMGSLRTRISRGRLSAQVETLYLLTDFERGGGIAPYRAAEKGGEAIRLQTSLRIPNVMVHGV